MVRSFEQFSNKEKLWFKALSEARALYSYTGDDESTVFYLVSKLGYPNRYARDVVEAVLSEEIVSRGILEPFRKGIAT